MSRRRTKTLTNEQQTWKMQENPSDDEDAIESIDLFVRRPELLYHTREEDGNEEEIYDQELNDVLGLLRIHSVQKKFRGGSWFQSSEREKYLRGKETFWRRAFIAEYIKIPIISNDYLSSLQEIKTAVQHLSCVEKFEEVVTPLIDFSIGIGSVKYTASKIE